MSATLWAMAVLFGELSLLAFGGGNTILPEMHRQVVEVHHWMSSAEFSALFALAQAAPGPNMMVVTLVGWHVAGWPGVLVSSLAKFGPSSLLTMLVMHGWERFKDRPRRRKVQAALVPVTAGLVVSSAILISQAANGLHPVLWGITAVCAVLAWRSSLHPLWLLAGGAVVGWLGVGQV